LHRRTQGYIGSGASAAMRPSVVAPRTERGIICRRSSLMTAVRIPRITVCVSSLDRWFTRSTGFIPTGRWNDRPIVSYRRRLRPIGRKNQSMFACARRPRQRSGSRRWSARNAGSRHCAAQAPPLIVYSPFDDRGEDGGRSAMVIDSVG